MTRQDELLIRDAASIARAISHPLRLQILNELRGDGAYVMHLTAVLGRPQANISQHLMVLRQAGLVRARREGMTVLYQLTDSETLRVVDSLLAMAERRTDALKHQADKEKEGEQTRPRKGKCRCPRCGQQIR